MIIILAGYVLTSLGPTIFKANQAVEQIGKDVENYNTKINLENLLKKIKNEQDLSDMHLKNLDLSGYDFSGKNLSNTHFDDSNLVNTDFTNANLNGVVFSPECTGKSWTGKTGICERDPLHLGGADFSNADLRNTTFKGKFGGVNFEGANFSGSNIEQLECGGCNFSNADLSYTVIHRFVSYESDFTNTNLENIKVDRLYYTGRDSFMNNLYASGQWEQGMCENNNTCKTKLDFEKNSYFQCASYPLDCTHDGRADWCTDSKCGIGWDDDITG